MPGWLQTMELGGKPVSQLVHSSLLFTGIERACSCGENTSIKPDKRERVQRPLRLASRRQLRASLLAPCRLPPTLPHDVVSGL